MVLVERTVETPSDQHEVDLNTRVDAESQTELQTAIFTENNQQIISQLTETKTSCRSSTEPDQSVTQQLQDSSRDLNWFRPDQM